MADVAFVKNDATQTVESFFAFGIRADAKDLCRRLIVLDSCAPPLV